MSEEQKKQAHILEQYPEDERIAYLSVLSAVCYADKKFSDEEKHQLETLLDQLKITDDGKATIYSSIFALHHENKLANLEIIQSLGNTDLKYTLISDLFRFSLSDGKLADEEKQYILEIGDFLDITEEQIDTLQFVQEKLSQIEDTPSTSEKTKQMLQSITEKLAGVGVPIGAIAASGSVSGLSAAGMTSGLASLGSLVGGGMLAGTVFVVPTLALGATYGIKKLFELAKENNTGSA